MSQSLDKRWTVIASVADDDNRCVDFFSRPEGTFGFDEFRRDVEDAGRWTPMRYFSGGIYTSAAEALDVAERTVPWLTAALAEKSHLRRLLS